MACVNGRECRTSGVWDFGGGDGRSCNVGHCPTREEWERALRDCDKVRRGKRACVRTQLQDYAETQVSAEMLDDVGVRDDASLLGDVMSNLGSVGFIADLIPIPFLDSFFNIGSGLLGESGNQSYNLPRGVTTEDRRIFGLKPIVAIVGGVALLIGIVMITRKRA